MNKQEEIEILESLKGDTYFSLSVGGDDVIDMMIGNIMKDLTYSAVLHTTLRCHHLNEWWKT